MNDIGVAPVANSFFGMGVVAILLPVLFLAVIFGFVILMRYLRYKENLLMIERGIKPEESGRKSARYSTPAGRLRGGIITAFVGLALFFGLLTMGWGPWLLGGLIPLAVGIGEILTFVLLSPTRDYEPSERDDDRR